MKRGTKIALAIVLASTGCSGDSGGSAPSTLGDVGSAAGTGAGASGSGGATSPTTNPTTDPAPTGGDPTTGEPVDSAPPDGIAAMDPTTPFSELPPECVGFGVLGLQYSPGGNVLPNKCAPFDNVLNNPYAIRCIDADPNYDTGWPGDEWCILPPEPNLGIQVGVIANDYVNPEPGFILEPGQEITNNYYANANNPEGHYYYRTQLRMRTGSHHIINSRIADRPDGWTSEMDTGLGNPSFPGAQRPDTDRPTDTLEIPSENAGLGEYFEPNQQLMYNMHHFNFGTTERMLREVWVNVWWKDQAEVTEALGGIGIFGNPIDLFLIGAGQRVELHYMCSVPGNTRIVTFNGHRHSHTDRFGVWIRRTDGTVESVYESFDYTNMPTYAYDSLAQNPVPDLANRLDGATTGVLNVSPGDELHYVCDITNRLTTNLRFGNQVLDAEMCILFGSRTGDDLCGNGTRVP